MEEPLQKVLHPEAIRKFESYLETLIAEAAFGWEFELECSYYFSFPKTILDKIENILKSVKYLDRNDIHSICHGILDHMFQKHDVIKRKLAHYFDGIDSDEYEPADRTLMIKDYLDDKFRVSVKHDMCKYFYGLPFDYVVLFPLPYVALPTSGPIKISEEIELLKIEKDFKISYTPPSWSRLLKDGLFNPPKSDKMVWVFPKPKKAYVLVKVQGASVYASISKMCKYATRQFKILVAALYALDIIRINEGSSRDFDIHGVLDSCLVTPVSKPRKMLRDENESSWIKLSPMD